jgi:pimeloyl-ACP methyl ester carboxylesterase
MASENTCWRAPELGETRELETSGGTLRAFVTGSGPDLVFVHGALVNANLWRKVIGRLASDFRCVALDMPLGSHELPMPDADLTPPGLADLIAEAIEALELDEPTLVGNDTGGALSQLVIDRHPERVGRLMLTSCDAYEQFPSRFFEIVLAPLMLPALVPILFAPLRLRAPRNTPLAFGWLMHTKVDPEAGDSYLLPGLTSKEIRADTKQVFEGIDPSYLLEAAARFSRFEKPVTIAWSRDDKFFHHRNAERLAAAFPDARLEWIEGARTFSAEDRPDRVAELAAELARRPAKEAAAGAAR